MTSVSIIEPPDEGTLGPAMLALTPRQRAFVVAMLDLPGIDHTAAAERAGYSATSRNSLRVQAHHLLHDEKILDAIQEESRRRLNSSTILAVSVLMEIASNTVLQPKDRLKAAQAILNRTGFNEKTEHHVKVEHRDATEEAMVERIKKFAGVLGLDAKLLLGQAGVVDAEFHEVETSTEGLEDLL